jgi:hypothetical protein
MPTLASRSATAIALVSGAVLWVATTTLTGRREAWDAPVYWTVTYPIGLVISAILGYLSRDRPWRWGMALMLAQAVMMAALAREFGLLPLGLILFGVLAVPLMLVARGAARFSVRASGE